MRALTKYNDMLDTNVSQRPHVLVNKRAVDLVQRSPRLLALDDTAKWRVFAVEILDVVGQRDEELATSHAVFALLVIVVLPAAASVRTAAECHTHCPAGRVL